MAGEPVSAGPEGTCRFNGENYRIGELACIRGKLSRCDMVINNTSWTVVGDSCPVVRAPQRPLLPPRTLAALSTPPPRSPWTGSGR